MKPSVKAGTRFNLCVAGFIKKLKASGSHQVLTLTSQGGNTIYTQEEEAHQSDPGKEHMFLAQKRCRKLEVSFWWVSYSAILTNTLRGFCCSSVCRIFNLVPRWILFEITRGILAKCDDWYHRSGNRTFEYILSMKEVEAFSKTRINKWQSGINRKSQIQIFNK